MLKIVIDTNIFVSGITWGGLPGKVIDQWLDDKYKLVISKEIILETIKTLRKLEVPENKINKLEAHLVEKAVMVEPKIKIDIVKHDPSDNKFLECAAEAQADFIISGDKDLLSLGNLGNIKIVTARNFLSVT